MQVAAERVAADAYIAVVLGGAELLRLEIGDLAVDRAVRQVKIEADHGRERRADVGEGLGEERHDELCPIVEVRVEVPPLVGSGAAVRAGPVLPWRYLICLDADPLIVLGCRSETGKRSVHLAPPFSPCYRNQAAA